MEKSDDHIDYLATMLAHLVCADAKEEKDQMSNWRDPDGATRIEADAGVKLRFDPIFPSKAYTGQLGGSRIYAQSPDLLLQSPQDLIGSKNEIALVDKTTVKWTAFKKIKKCPKGVWVSSRGADLYEVHYRHIYANGRSTYDKRLAAINKAGNAIPVVIEGSGAGGKGGRSTHEGNLLIIAASVIEDAYRPDAFVAEVSDSAGVIFPVKQGEHLEVFRLRDGPMVGDRRKALLHWVAKHIRKKSDAVVDVKAHLRGVHEFTIDGLSVKLESGQEIAHV